MKIIIALILLLPLYAFAQGTGGDLSSGTGTNESDEFTRTNSSNEESSRTKRRSATDSKNKSTSKAKEESKSKTNSKEKSNSRTTRLEVEQEVNLSILFYETIGALESAAHRGEIRGPNANGLRYCSLFTTPIFTATYNNSAWQGGIDNSFVMKSFMSVNQTWRLLSCSEQYHQIASEVVPKIYAKNYVSYKALKRDFAAMVSDEVATSDLYSTLDYVKHLLLKNSKYSAVTLRNLAVSQGYCQTLTPDSAFIEWMPCIAELDMRANPQTVIDNDRIHGEAYVRLGANSVQVKPDEMLFSFGGTNMISKDQLNNHTYKVEVEMTNEESLAIRNTKENRHSINLSDNETRLFNVTFEKAKQKQVSGADNITRNYRATGTVNSNSSVSNIAK